MDMELDAPDRELQRHARAFAEEWLLPYELECEANDGLTPESWAAIRKATVDWKLNAINHAREDGGQGYDLFQQALVEEELGKATGSLWDVPWRPALPLRHCTDEQRREYLRPACAGERRDAYAITESSAGSDASAVETTATRDADGYVIDGVKWHVTAGDIADFILVHAHVDGDPSKATIFFVDKNLDGVRVERTPKYMHTFVFEHPIFAFDGVRVGEDKVLGGVGRGLDLTKDWFVEERLMIAARTVGAATRALDLSLSFARERVQHGGPIVGHQSIEFMLADMATEVMAAKSLLYRVAWRAGRTDVVRKDLHGLCATAKLYCSEMAGRVIDAAVQIHGGRGYMREEPVERLYREVRVDRIWEGTSEIQRVIIGNELQKRGPALFTGWP